MSIQEQSVKTGTWLFRWRSYLPLVLISLIIPALYEFSYPFTSHAYDLVWEMICLAVSFFGLLIRCYTIGHTPKGTSGRNTKGQLAETLNTTGIYSVTRNPLYLGNFFMVLGVTIFVRVWWCPVIYAMAFWLYYERIIMAEEFFLRKKFGKFYDSYSIRTPVFIPNFKLWEKPELALSCRNILKREYPGFFGVVASFTALEFLGSYVAEGRFVFDQAWVVIFVISSLIYLTLRTLKKKTKLLHVEGR